MPASAIMAPMPATTGGRLRAAGLAAAVAAWALSLGGCTDDSEEPKPPDGQPGTVALELSLGAGSHRLSTEARDDLQNDVGAVLSTYVVDAFLGDYPRDDFVTALDTFTSGVARDAATDIEEITGAGFKNADTVVATRLRASIATFAPDDEAVGVSAHVDFAFEVTENDAAREVTMRGRLMLMPVDGQWKIFGYDVETDDPGSGGTS
jgi:hypothetical protein